MRTRKLELGTRNLIGARVTQLRLARGMKQVSDTGAIEAVVDAVIAAHPDEVARYKDGNQKLIGFFVGQCMKEMRGQGNPKVINQMLAKKLNA